MPFVAAHPVPPVAVVLVNAAVAVAVVTTAKKALTRIGKNWVKEGENEQENVDAVQIGVCISVCAQKTIIRPRLRKGKRVESTKRSNSSRRRQRRVRENLLLASQMVGYIEIHIAYRASLTNNI